MKPIDLIATRKQHIERLANQRGAAGELDVLNTRENWIPRPRGQQLRMLLAVLRESGVIIRPSSFDAIEWPSGCLVDFNDEAAVRAVLHRLVFIEIKTSNQPRVGGDFSGFFFALTEAEIAASEALGERHRVVLFNKRTGDSLLTSVPEILRRAKSMNWQLSVQL